MSEIKFSRICQPLNKMTFKAPKTRAWVEEQCKGKSVLNVFAGETRLRDCMEITNDLSKDVNVLYHMDALEFVKYIAYNDKPFMGKFDVVLLDPPYSFRKSMELYNGNKASRFKQVLDVIPDLLKPDGIVITFGYHSSVMSAKRGFKIKEILLISHGGAQHDTIVSVEGRILMPSINCCHCGSIIHGSDNCTTYKMCGVSASVGVK